MLSIFEVKNNGIAECWDSSLQVLFAYRRPERVESWLRNMDRGRSSGLQLLVNNVHL